jgi:hypothetical protein
MSESIYWHGQAPYVYLGYFDAPWETEKMKYCPFCFQSVAPGVVHICFQKRLVGARQINITITDNDGFTVQEGEHFADRLNFDEMLGQVVHLAHPAIRKSHYAMLTAREWIEQEARWRGLRSRRSTDEQ